MIAQQIPALSACQAPSCRLAACRAGNPLTVCDNHQAIFAATSEQILMAAGKPSGLQLASATGCSVINLCTDPGELAAGIRRFFRPLRTTSPYHRVGEVIAMGTVIDESSGPAAGRRQCDTAAALPSAASSEFVVTAAEILHKRMAGGLWGFQNSAPSIELCFMQPARNHVLGPARVACYLVRQAVYRCAHLVMDRRERAPVAAADAAQQVSGLHASRASTVSAGRPWRETGASPLSVWSQARPRRAAT